MGRQPDNWVRQWIEQKRAEGKRGLTVEKINNRHYVYWASTEWVPETKKRKKLTEYIGVLDPPGNLIISSDIDLDKMNPKAIAAADIDIEKYRKRPEEIIEYKITGQMLVIQRASSDFYDILRDCFPEACDDLMMLAAARLAGRGRLCQAGRWFATQDNVMCIDPHKSPEALSLALKIAGGAVSAKNRFYEALGTRGKKLAVDMTVCFSKGKSYLIKKGYNRFRLSCGQFNIALICGLDDKMPQAMRTVAGNVKEGSILDMLHEMDIGTDCVLVMDRGYFSTDLMDELHIAGYKFVLPVRRNSQAYDEVKITKPKGFKFRGSSVLYAIGNCYGYNAYRFENQDQKNKELQEMMGFHTISEDLAPCFIDSDDVYALDGDPSKAGNLILVTNINEDPANLYTMYKMRCSVEECYDASKNVLSADSTYLRDDYSIMGFNFVTFLALRMYMRIESWIAESEKTSKYTPRDVLFEYGSLCSVITTERRMSQRIPANVVQIEKDLGLGIVDITKA